MAKLNRAELRPKVKAYFEGQLEHYLGRLNLNDPMQETLDALEAEVLRHEELLKERSTDAFRLYVEKFKVDAGISDHDWGERALLHKSVSEGTSPFPGRNYPTGSVTGMPRA
ncbi:MAGE domain-containing protein, partial [Phaeobacter sp. CECT 5382]|uniref:MAGE domain-containing protein n=1 Tax=Phaeobacter sp. CECT 5382 TaxID=1712645 RepID=UPI001E2D5C84